MNGGKAVNSVVKEVPNPLEAGTGMGSSTKTHFNTPAESGAKPTVPGVPSVAPEGDATTGMPGSAGPTG